MPNTQYEANIINSERHRQADEFRQQLEKWGVQCETRHYNNPSGDFFSTEYHITFRSIHVMQPTFDLALMDFVGQLLKTPIM